FETAATQRSINLFDCSVQLCVTPPVAVDGGGCEFTPTFNRHRLIAWFTHRLENGPERLQTNIEEDGDCLICAQWRQCANPILPIQICASTGRLKNKKIQ
ncbi:hypothetical protein XENOCAPTIV_024580, partial [Xenoophorus captivus]